LNLSPTSTTEVQPYQISGIDHEYPVVLFSWKEILAIWPTFKETGRRMFGEDSS